MPDKYWCKNCEVFVVDTKLQRANHEATGRHQSAVRRALRNLHRDHERQEREKEAARREVARVSAIAEGKPIPAAPRSRTNPTEPAPATVPRREQLEQLAELGVSIPEEFRADLAMAGDWTVTETRVVEVQGGKDGSDENKPGGGATWSFGVRKRPRSGAGAGDDDDDDDEDKGGHAESEKVDLDAAVQGLFKKPRHWGRDSKTAGGAHGGGDGDGDNAAEDLDSLLSSVVAKPTAEKKEEEGVEGVKREGSSAPAPAPAPEPALSKIKTEADAEADADATARLAADAAKGPPEGGPAVLFKKRKGKPGRSK